MACSPAAGAPRTSCVPANCSCRQSFPSMPSKQSAPILPIAPMLPSRKQQSSAPAAAAACSSSSGSNGAQLRSTDPVRHRHSSGSTPHDPVTSDQRELPSCFCWLTARRTWVRMHPVDLQTTALAIISRNQQCHSSAAACSFSREQNTVSTCRALTSPASPACPDPHSVLRHHSPAALLSRYLLTRFRALALFGRRPGERVVSSRRRAAENLTNSGGCHYCRIVLARGAVCPPHLHFVPDAQRDLVTRKRDGKSGELTR